MSEFKIYNCDLGLKYNDTNYAFDNVDSVTVEDPENTKIVRGANGSSKTGLVYTEGVKEPKRLTTTLIGVSTSMFNLLKTIYESKARIEVFCVDRLTGSSRIAKNAILSQLPRQMTIDETAESMNVDITVETFDLSENHKD